MRVRLDNTDVGAFVVEQVEEDLLAEGGRVMKASGRGLLALFERGIVWPADVNAYYSAERTFLADTFASMIIDLAAEATARGVSLPTDDFSATLDSSGAAWTDSYTLAYRAGQTLLDVILHQAEIGPEVTISPAGVLHYWIQAGSDKSSTVLLREGQSVAKAGRTTSHRDLVNAVLGQGQYAFSVQTDATSISSYGRRERLANFGNVSDSTQLQTLSQWARDEWKNPAVQIEMDLVDDALTPFVSFDLGDTVGVRLVTAGLSASYRVRAIAIEQDGESHVRAAVTLNTLLNEYLLRVDRALRRALMSPVESENQGNSDPNIGSWRISKTYLIYDTGTAATSAGLAPLDYPFFAGQVYASRASAPFRVSSAGALVATNATITGTVTASAGAIGGWTIGASSLTGGNATLHSSGYLLLGTSNDIARLDAADATYRLWIGHATAGSAPFRVTKAGALTATSATITGTITSTSGTIGGWTLGASSLTGGNATLHSSGYLLLGTSNDIARVDASDATYRLWVGHATAGSAPFRVTKAGALTATSATITGTITSTSGTIGGWTLGASTLTGGDATLSSAGYLDLGTGNDIVRMDASNATYRLWIGNATASSAPFRITKAGYVTAISGSIGGFTLSGTKLYNGTFELDAGNGRVTFNTGAYFSTGGGTVINATCSVLYSSALITAETGLAVNSTSAVNIIHGDTQIDKARIGYPGFYGTSPVATQQTVTGSRGGNAALASLLTALATYGLIINSSSA